MATGGYPTPPPTADWEPRRERESTPSSMPELERLSNGSSPSYAEKGIREPSEKDTVGFIPGPPPRSIAEQRRRNGEGMPRAEAMSDRYSTTSSDTDPVHWLYPPKRGVCPYECGACGKEFRRQRPMHEHVRRYHREWQARCLGSVDCANRVYFNKEALAYHQKVTGHKGIQFQQEGDLDLDHLSSN